VVVSREDQGSPLFHAWAAAGRLAMRYFSYRIEGLEHLDRETALIVAYHPGPFPWDNFMLWTKLYDTYGSCPRMISHHLYHQVPVVRGLSRTVGLIDGEPPRALVEALRPRQHLLVCPGGTREGLRPFWRRHRVDWGGRTGFIRLARKYRLTIVPAASAAAELSYLGLVDGYALSRRVFGHGGMPLWTGVGIGGLWPFALPWPVRIRHIIGRPIEIDAFGGGDEATIQRTGYEIVTRAVQDLLDELTAR
jgi:1-acyl-sn-glycerol-3-phosphate acyltransferase